MYTHLHALHFENVRIL